MFNGFFNDVTHSELRGISNTLTQLTPEQTNNVVASLGFYSAIYQQEGDGADASSSYAIAFRGTEDWTDWKTNIASTFGPTKKFEMANELVEQLVEKVGADNVVVTGHSLGGGLANYAAMRNEVHSVGLNPKGTASWEAEKIGDVDTFAETYIQNYRVKGEILTSVQENRIPIIQSAAPGPSIDLPSINPDGTDSSLVNDIKGRISGSGGDQQFARSIRRHGSVNVIRGMGELIERTETKALNEILDSHSK